MENFGSGAICTLQANASVAEPSGMNNAPLLSPAIDAGIANVITMDEARRVASNLAKLPTLLSKRPDGFKFAGASDIRALTNNHEEQSRWPDLRSAALVVNGQHTIFAS